jgi:hypothetical protein
MRDDGRNGTEPDLVDIENAFGRLSPSPVPPGLRRRVMDRALEARRSAAASPGMRILAIACSLVIVAVLVIEPLVGRHEAARLAAMLDGGPSTPVVETAPELAEVLAGQRPEAALIVRIRAATKAAAREDIDRVFIEARKRLKGWLEDETSENPD